MKTLRIITTLIVTMMLSISMSMADGNDSNTEDLIDKQEAKIEKARSQDWKLYAECADVLIKARISNKDVLSWINKSIEIKETVYNRTLMGDYLVLENKTTEAKKEYIKAISLAQKNGEKEKISGIQWKILVAMGVENYNNFHANKN
jgi:hypothetical protein